MSHAHGTPGRRAISLLLLAAAFTSHPGCQIASQRYSIPHVQNFSLAKSDLERGGLAFLTPSTVTGQEEDKQPLALVFTDALTQRRPDMRIMTLAATLSAVNRAGLTDVYKRMYQDYRDTGLFDPALLSQVGNATGMRYAAQLKMAGFRQGAKSRFGMLGLDILQTQTATIRMFFQVWDTRTGIIAWEGVEELTSAFDTISERTVGFRTMVDGAARELIVRLP